MRLTSQAMHTLLRCLLLLWLSNAWVSTATADICRSKAPDGSIMITNLCNQKTSQRIIKSRPASPNYANIYKYTDTNGVVSYGDAKPVNAPFQLVSLGRPKPLHYFESLAHYKPNKHKFNDLIAQASLEHQVDEKLLHAVIQSESAYNANAVSSAGAVGLMQLMAPTAARYGVYDRNDPEQNISAGTRYLKDLLAMFDDNVELAVAAYNAGEGAVKKYNNTIPPYRETQNYVRQVLALYSR
ncbi:MAG: lytic transglycosylase domain-containing protein [Methylococcaceae bacterium]